MEIAACLRRLEAAQKALDEILDKDADRFGPEFETILSAYRVIERKAERARAPRETGIHKTALDGAAERR